MIRERLTTPLRRFMLVCGQRIASSGERSPVYQHDYLGRRGVPAWCVWSVRALRSGHTRRTAPPGPGGDRTIGAANVFQVRRVEHTVLATAAATFDRAPSKPSPTSATFTRRTTAELRADGR